MPLNEEGKAVIRRRDALLADIADSYARMATNEDIAYRVLQKAKCDAWLAELTALCTQDPYHFAIHPAEHL